MVKLSIIKTFIHMLWLWLALEWYTGQLILNIIDMENFIVRKLRKAHILTKLKHPRFFYYDNFTSNMRFVLLLD